MRYQEEEKNQNPVNVQETSVIGPKGKPITRNDLPAPGIERWVVRRKAEVVEGVRGGLITLQEACERYNLSKDEFETWLQLFKDHGLAGLRATRLKKTKSHPRLRS